VVSNFARRRPFGCFDFLFYAQNFHDLNQSCKVHDALDRVYFTYGAPHVVDYLFQVLRLGLLLCQRVSFPVGGGRGVVSMKMLASLAAATNATRATAAEQSPSRHFNRIALQVSSFGPSSSSGHFSNIYSAAS
jgi:hypothetical protein